MTTRGKVVITYAGKPLGQGKKTFNELILDFNF